MKIFYRRWIPHATEIQRPLNALLNGCTRRNVKIEATRAFEECKQQILDASLLSYPCPDSELSIATDASNHVIGGVLQQTENGKTKPLGFFSKKLTGTQQRYSTYDRELLAVHETIKYFQHLLEERIF